MSKTPAGKKDLSSKLAGAVRAARTEHDAETAVGVLPPVPYGEERQRRVQPMSREGASRERPTLEVRAAKPPVARPRARQSSPDNLRDNLHPERIWPD